MERGMEKGKCDSFTYFGGGGGRYGFAEGHLYYLTRVLSIILMGEGDEIKMGEGNGDGRRGEEEGVGKKV